MPDQPRQSSRGAYALIFWGALVLLLIHAYPVLQPIILALLLIILLSLALNPVVARLRGVSGGRSRATLLVVLAFLVIAGLTAWGFYQPVKKSTAEFIQHLPEYWERVQKPLVKIEQKAVVTEQKLQREVTSEIKQEIARTNQQHAADVPPPPTPQQTAAQHTASQGGIFRSGLTQLLGGLSGVFGTLASNALAVFTIVITVFVGTIFTLLSPRPMVAFTFSLIPERHHDRAMRIIQRIVKVIPQWAMATVLGMSVIGSLTFAAMWWLLGFQDAVVLGLIAFVFEAVPYIGPILSVVPAVLLAVTKGGLTPLWVMLAYFAIQMIENHLIIPKVVAGKLKLNPVGVMFSILLCVATFGVLGVILAVPMVAVVNIIHDELYRPRFLPHVSDEQLNEMARVALNERAVTRKSMFKRIRRRQRAHEYQSGPSQSGNGDNGAHQ